MAAAWTVVADTTRARILAAEKAADELVEIQTLTCPSARLHEGELTSDRPGRDRNGSSSGSHDMGHLSDASHEDAVRFAGELSEYIESARAAGRFRKLYIIAAPAFLGILRKHHSSATRQLIASEINKNLTTHSLAEIRRQLPEYL